MIRETIIVNAGTVHPEDWHHIAKLRVSKVSDGVRVATPEGYSGIAFSVARRDKDIVLEELRRRGYEVTTFHATNPPGAV